MTTRILCLAVLLLCPMGIAAEPSWPVFHGPNRDNVSPETGLLKSWKEGGPPLLWKVSTIGDTESPGFASVTVADGRVFTAGNVKTGDSDQEAVATVFALDEKTGKELWRYANGPGWTDKGKFPGERSTPTIDGDRIYAFSAQGRMACLEAATGKEIWARDLRKEFGAEPPNWGYAESPFVDGNKVICWIGGDRASAVALDKMTGRTLWETPGAGQRANYASMVAFKVGEQRIYVNMDQSGILGVDAENGDYLFSIPHKTEYDVMATTPYFFGDSKLFFTSGYGTGARLFDVVNTASGTASELVVHQVWSNPQFDNMHGGVVIKDGYAYMATHYHGRQRNWACLKLEDGSIMWENEGVRMGAIHSADGMLYCVQEQEPHAVALVKATPEKYEETGRFELPNAAAGGGEGTLWAHPVVCNKKLYIRHGKVLYCYDVAEK